MSQQTGDECLSNLGEASLSARLMEGVDVPLEQGQMEMHPRSVVCLQRLGHERCVYAVLQRHLLDGESGGHDVVRHRQGVGVPGDDLVLARRNLVMGVLDRDPELLEGIDRLASVLLGHVQGSQVEVSAMVEDLGIGPGILEVEELQFGCGEERVAHL